jgi:predicted nucleotidyltransferase
MSVRENVARVVSRLGDLKQDMVLVGGASVHFLVPPSLAAEIRPTEDVDFVVDVESISDWVDFIPRLRKQNFAEYTENDPPLICRWIVDGILVDIIPTDPRFLGFSNRWYTSALAMADSVEVAPGLHCRIIDLASFVATKFEAFDSRGTNDYVADTDFEDIIN